MIKNFLSDISVPLDTLPYIRMDVIKFYFVLEADKVQVAQAFKSLKRKTSKKIFDRSKSEWNYFTWWSKMMSELRICNSQKTDTFEDVLSIFI